MTDGLVITENVVGYDGAWQYPARTEQLAFERCRVSFSSTEGSTYVGFPWATLIDHAQTKSPGVQQLDEALADVARVLERRPQSERRITVCQHIWALKYREKFEQLGITDLFWSHAEFKTRRAGGIRLHPFPLYPVQTANLTATYSGKPLEDRTFLFSFAGAYDSRFYRTAVREWILALPESSPSYRAFLRSRHEWHYQRIVYDEQIKGVSISGEDRCAINDRASEYLQVLADSVFSLCPSGSGPNSIRLWESLAVGAIPVVLADGLRLPGSIDAWMRAVVFVRESAAAVRSLPELLQCLLANPRLLSEKRAACRAMYAKYGPSSFIPDIVAMGETAGRRSARRELSRIAIVDPSLRDSFSHHHAINRNLASLSTKRGHDLVVYGHRDGLFEGFPYKVEPIFAHGIYEDRADTPTRQFQSLVSSHYKALQHIVAGETRFDLLILHSATAALLQALALSLAPGRTARVRSLAIELMFHPLTFCGKGDQERSTSHARYMTALGGLLRNAGIRGVEVGISTSCTDFAETYSRLLRRPIPIHPYALSCHEEAPVLAAPPRMDEILLFCGDPKADKGLPWINEALPQILSCFPRQRFLIQLGINRFRDPEVEAAAKGIRETALRSANLELVEGHLTGASWRGLIGRIGVVVIPYDPDAYRYKTSGIYWEATQIIFPSVTRRLVVTRGSWMERESQSTKLEAAVVCDYEDTESLCNALYAALATKSSAPHYHSALSNDIFLLEALPQNRAPAVGSESQRQKAAPTAREGQMTEPHHVL